MVLYDAYNRPIKTKKPETNRIAEYSALDSYSEHPSVGLTPETLASLLIQAESGDVFSQMQLFEDMEEKDLHLTGILEKRKRAVCGLKWDVLPASEDKKDTEIAAFVKEVFEYIENFDDAVFDILDAIGKGFSVSEIMWEYAEGKNWVREINWVNQKKFRFWKDNKLIDVPLLITEDNHTGIDLAPYKFIYHRHKAKSGHVTRCSLLRSAAIYYLFKNYDVKSWIIFLERFGHPLRIGRYQAGASAEDKATLKRAVYNLATDAAAVLSADTEVEFVRAEAAKENSKMFAEFADWIDGQFSKLILGHTGAADSTPGKLGGEDSADDLRQDLLEADAKALMRTIKRDLITPIIYFNYGAGVAVPDFTLNFEPPEDLKTEAETIKILSDSGFKNIPLSYIHSKFNIPEPQKGEAVLSNPKDSTLPGESFERSSLSKSGFTSPTDQTKQNLLTMAREEPQEGATPCGAEADSVRRERSVDFSGREINTDVEVYELYQAQLEENVNLSGIIDPIKDMLDGCESLEEFRDRLLDVYGEMDTEELQQMMEQALITSELAGRFEARKP